MSSSRREGQVLMTLSIFRSVPGGPSAILIQKNIHTELPLPPTSDQCRETVLTCRHSLLLRTAWLTPVLLMLSDSQTFSGLQTRTMLHFLWHRTNARKHYRAIGGLLFVTSFGWTNEQSTRVERNRLPLNLRNFADLILCSIRG